jgi:hypothetical protein
MLYSLLFLPGTIIHELSHWIVAEVLGVRTGTISIFPDLESSGDTRRLGSVATQRSDPFRAFLIGIAPFISGLAILVVLGRLLSDGLGVFSPWVIAAIIYGVMVIGNSMMISESDRRTWPFILIVLILIAIVITKYYPSLIWDHVELYLSVLNPLVRVLGVTAVINLVMIGGSYIARRIVERMTGKRIIHK